MTKMNQWYRNGTNFQSTGWHLCEDAKEIGWTGKTETVPDLKGGFFSAPVISDMEMDRLLAASQEVAETAELCIRRGVNPLPTLRKLTPSLRWEYVRGQQCRPEGVAAFAVAEVGNCIWDWVVAR
jgi:hypothetical protein